MLLMQLSNTRLEWFIVKYHNAILSHDDIYQCQVMVSVSDNYAQGIRYALSKAYSTINKFQNVSYERQHH